MSTTASASSVPAEGFRKAAVILLGLIGAIQVADPLISSLALAKASDELNFTASQASMAAGISTLALAATAIPGGLLADRLGRRNIIAFSLILAAIGEVMTAMTPKDAIFVYFVGRIITGIALGMTFGGSYGMLHYVSAPKALGPAMATFNVLNGVVPVIALVLGGVLLADSWRVAYLILPVLAIALFFIIPFILPKVDRIGSGKVDFVGMLLVAVGIVGLLDGLSGATNGLRQPGFYVPVIVGIVAFILFGIRESKTDHPVFPIKILKHPAFLGAVIMGIFWNFASAGLSQMLPNIWQYVTHIPSAILGAASLPMSAAGIIGSVVAGTVIGKGAKPRTTATIGYALMVVGIFYYVILQSTDGYLLFLPGMIVAAIGWMMNATSQGNLFINLAPAKFYGAVTSSKMTVGQFGYALGLTGTTVLVSTFTLNGVDTASKGAVSGDSNWDAITSFLATGNTSNSALQSLGQAKIAEIYTSAFSTTAVIVAIVVALAGAGMYVLLKNKKADVPVEEFLAAK
jgi:MFS family permease